MSTINIGPFTATITGSETNFSGTLKPIVYQVGQADIIRISAADNPNEGARLLGHSSPSWLVDMSGKVVILGDRYSHDFNVQISETSFDVPLPPAALEVPNIGSVDVSGRVKLAGGALTLSVEVDITVAFDFLGISVDPVCSYEEATTIDVGAESLTKSIAVAASVFGVEVKTPTLTVSLSVPTIEGIASQVYEVLADQVEDAINDYLLAWANELADLGETVGNYIADFGAQIVDAFESLFGSGSSSGPPPPFLVNTFAGSAPLGSDGMVKFGQALSTSDSKQSFAFPKPFFGGTCRAALLNAARPNVWSALAVESRTSDDFAVNRDDAVDYHVPFHWLAFGPAPGKSLSESGYIDVGDVRIQWGLGTSSVDGDQTFNLPSGFGSGPVAVVVNTDTAGVRSALALASIDAAAGRFVINRDNAIDGSVNFTYLAIGPAPGRSLSQGLLRYQGLTLQWGKTSSSTDGEQLIPFPASFGSMNFSVVISFLQADVQSSLALSRAINEAGFIVNRDARIDGVVPFNWIAVGW